MTKRSFRFLPLAMIPLCGCLAPNLEQRVLQMVEAHNQHDVPQELTFYADDATFMIAEEPPLVGRAALRDLFEADAVANSELVFNDVVVRGDTVTASVIERNDLFRGMGIPEIEGSTRLVFRKGLIQKVEAGQLAEEDLAALENAWSAVGPWLQAAHPDLANEVESGWLARHDARATRAWLELLAEWRATVSNGK